LTVYSITFKPGHANAILSAARKHTTDIGQIRYDGIVERIKDKERAQIAKMKGMHVKLKLEQVLIRLKLNLRPSLYPKRIQATFLPKIANMSLAIYGPLISLFSIAVGNTISSIFDTVFNDFLASLEVDERKILLNLITGVCSCFLSFILIEFLL